MSIRNVSFLLICAALPTAFSAGCRRDNAVAATKAENDDSSGWSGGLAVCEPVEPSQQFLDGPHKLVFIVDFAALNAGGTTAPASLLIERNLENPVGSGDNSLSYMVRSGGTMRVDAAGWNFDIPFAPGKSFALTAKANLPGNEVQVVDLKYTAGEASQIVQYRCRAH